MAPMIFETSMQALFLGPMAISLGMGTVVSAFVVLFLITSVNDIVEDLRGDWRSARLPMVSDLGESEPAES